MGHLIDIVQSHMDAYGVSEAEVSRRIGASPATVNTWRNSQIRQLPRREYLEGLSDLTGRKYDDVLLAALRDSGYVADFRTYAISQHLSQSLVAGTGKTVTLAEDLVAKAIDFADPEALTDTDQEMIQAQKARLREVTEILYPTLNTTAGIQRYGELLNDILKKVKGVYRRYIEAGGVAFRHPAPPIAGPFRGATPAAGTLGGLTGGMVASWLANPVAPAGPVSADPNVERAKFPVAGPGKSNPSQSDSPTQSGHDLAARKVTGEDKPKGEDTTDTPS
ncbi:hypothetical protein [Mycobacteroides abscessus]|uniref:hypothetical protein n=1 Tax=Mycobacteroides abscessus TaxID=36809 RepID=UPI001F29B332|nr:hypothetical protein [Mycobacteroides abscessus]